MKKVNIAERKDVYWRQCRTCQHNKCDKIDCEHCICLYETGAIAKELNCHCFDLVASDIINKLPICGFYIKSSSD